MVRAIMLRWMPQTSLRERWPELSAHEASAEVVAAIAYASTRYAVWFWDGVGAAS
jgi:hypothetical protein